MDDAARLVSDLLDKLADLNGKVAAYQRDMLTEFRKCLEECLRNCPDDVSNKVTRVIDTSMSKYPALSVDLSVRDLAVSPAANQSGNVCNGRTSRTSPPPVLHHTSGTPKERPRSPHQREREFHGVFTPSYLPLLDSNERRNPSLPPPAAPALKPIPDEATDTSYKAPPDSLTVATSAPCRRMTHHSSSSVESTASDVKQRRSALRRCSSFAKCNSPRRVRFDFEGKEVFPASPHLSTLTNMMDKTYSGSDADNSAIITEDEPSRYSGTSLLDIEGEEDMLPRPKKVSSTQALRALSKIPLEGGTTWRMVTPNTKESGDTCETERVNRSTPPSMSTPGGPVLQEVQLSRGSSEVQRRSQEKDENEVASEKDVTRMIPEAREVSSSPRDVNASEEEINSMISRGRGTVTPSVDEDEDFSEEEFLSMKSRTRGISTSPPRSPIVRNFSNEQVIVEHVEHVEYVEHAEHIERAEDDSANVSTHIERTEPECRIKNEADYLFSFDADEVTPSTSHPCEPTKYLPEEEDTDPDVTSTAARRELTPPLEPVDAASSLVSPSAAVFAQVLGSYKGNPVRMLPINNPSLYDKVAKIEDVPFWVGSVDGRSGAEAADLGSYRASLARGVTGTPKSLIERLALEETMDKRGAQGDATNEEEQG